MPIFTSRWDKHMKKLSTQLFQDKRPITLFTKQCFLLSPIAIDNLLTFIMNHPTIKKEIYHNIDKKLYKTSSIQTKEIISFFLLDYLFEFRQNDEHIHLINQIGYQQFSEFEDDFLTLLQISKKDAVYKEFEMKQFSFSHTHYFLQMIGLSYEDASNEPVLLVTEEIKNIFYHHFDNYLSKLVNFLNQTD